MIQDTAQSEADAGGLSSTICDSSVVQGAVVYTDGSCKYTNPGSIGWGAHGYIYNLVTPKKPAIVDNHYITNHGYLRVDHKKHKVEPYVEVEATEYIDFMGSSLSIATNNVAELQAACYTLERLGEMDLKYINIYTDSEYVRKGMTAWCKNWEYHQWKEADGSYIKNHEWWMRTYGKYKELMERGVKVVFDWIRGHNGSYGNIHADVLAGIGTNYSLARTLKNQYKFTPAKGYWKQDIDRHPFLNFKRIYFNSVEQCNIAGHYFQADTGAADNLIGKRIPATGLSVIKLMEKDHAIESVKQRQYEVAKEMNAIIMMKLDRVFSKDVYPYIADHGKYSLLTSKGNLNLNFFDKQPVTVEMNPTGLSLRAIESFNLLEELLDKFLNYSEVGFNQPDNASSMNAHDVTDVFYNREEKIVKKTPVTHSILKPEFIVGFQDMSIDIQEPYEGAVVTLKVPLILGTDLLPRNNLKRLEDQNPTVHLITWRESKNSIRYATIIRCDSGIGIWSNFFADKIFFTKPNP